MRWLAPALLLAFAAVLTCLAGASVSAQLEARARADAARYAASESPFDWDFSDPDAVVGPPQGLQLQRRDAQGLSLALVGREGDLGLRFSGRRVDSNSLPRLRLDYLSDAPLALRLAAASDLNPLLASGPWIQLPPGERSLQLMLAEQLPPGVTRLAQLRLQLQGAPGDSLRLRRAVLLPARCGELACLPARIELPARHSTAATLALRDALLEQQPHALIGAPHLAWLVSLVRAADALHWSIRLLSVTCLLAGVALLRRRCSVRGRAIAALTLGALLPIGLLALGLPRFPSVGRDALLLAALLPILWLLRPLSPARPRAPAAPAWRAAALFSLCALLLLVSTALWSQPRAYSDSLLSVERLLRYGAWACLQQLWLARFTLPHLQALGWGRASVPAAALLFAGLHLPNLELMGLTLLGGLGWAWLAQRYERLLPQAASHLLLGIAAIALLPPALLRSAEVGGRFVFAPL